MHNHIFRMAAGLAILVCAAIALPAQDQEAATFETTLSLTPLMISEADAGKLLPPGYEAVSVRFDPYYQNETLGYLYDAWLLMGETSATVPFGGQNVDEPFAALAVVIPVRAENSAADDYDLLITHFSTDNPLVHSLVESTGMAAPDVSLTLEERVMPDNSISLVYSGSSGTIAWQHESRSVESSEFSLPFNSLQLIIWNGTSAPEQHTLLVQDGFYLRAAYRDANLTELIENLGFRDARWLGSQSYQLTLNGTLR